MDQVRVVRAELREELLALEWSVSLIRKEMPIIANKLELARGDEVLHEDLDKRVVKARGAVGAQPVVLVVATVNHQSRARPKELTRARIRHSWVVIR